jgi:parallel beta-helix repeat protein
MSAKLRVPAAPATVIVFVVMTALVVAGLVALSGAEAAGEEPKCGDTITADTTLHKDLVNCPNNGIIIGADGITLDLNGHTIDGDGTPTTGCDPETEFCDEGLPNLGHDGVTVMHGSVRDFAFGPEVARARRVRLLDISSTRHTLFGLVFFKSTRSVVRHGSFSRNVAPDGDGIGVFRSDHLRILRNEIRRNPGPGIHVDHSAENLIKRNVFSRNGPGIILEKADRNRVRRNHLSRRAGILVAPGDRNVIARNRVFRALDSIAIEDGRGNVVARNLVVSAHRDAIRLGIRRPSIGGANNVVRRNRVRGSGDDGFHVYEKDGHSLLRRNVATGSGDDGFDVESPSTNLTRNRAMRNADLGIEAVRGVIDGGRNIARHNGGPRQCRHIACR